MLCTTICLLVISYITIGVVGETPVDYSQHKIIRVLPNELKQLDVLEKIKSDFNVNFWNQPMTDLRPVLTLISPKQVGFLSALNSSNIKYEIAANSFQKVIDAEREQNDRNKQFFEAKAFDYDTVFHTYDEIKTELQTVASTSGGRATYKSIGTTFEGRAIPSITITNTTGSTKKAIILECGIHAREWITPAFCLWVSHQLLTNTTYNALLNKYEFIIVPTLNADGYVYTWTTNREWRKTRTGPVSGCYGTDPNRNWDTAFCAKGASTDPCHDDYCGTKAFSEPCAKAMADLILSKKGNIAAYFGFHSNAQMWIWPWGYTDALPPNNADLTKLATAGTAAIKNTNGLTFTQGNIAKAIYLASGSSVDWAYDKAGVKIAYALELRDKSMGFILPPTQIKPACTETWNGVSTAINLLDTVPH